MMRSVANYFEMRLQPTVFDHRCSVTTHEHWFVRFKDMVLVKSVFVGAPLDRATIVRNLAIVFAKRFERFNFKASIKDGVKFNVASDRFQFRVAYFNLRDA